MFFKKVKKIAEWLQQLEVYTEKIKWFPQPTPIYRFTILLVKWISEQPKRDTGNPKRDSFVSFHLTDDLFSKFRSFFSFSGTENH
jgi:hypothetical protein